MDGGKLLLESSGNTIEKVSSCGKDGRAGPWLSVFTEETNSKVEKSGARLQEVVASVGL